MYFQCTDSKAIQWNKKNEKMKFYYPILDLINVGVTPYNLCVKKHQIWSKSIYKDIEETAILNVNQGP